MRVRATDKYEKLNLQDNELKRIPKAGEEFEVTDERYKVLTKTNSFNVAFVEKIEEIEIATVKAEVETAVKKTRAAIVAGNKEVAETCFKAAESALMSAANKKTLHKKAASRKVSRLAAAIKKM